MNTYVRQSILYLTGDSRRFFLCIRCNQLIEKLSRRASLSFSFAIEYVSDVTVRARGNRQIDASFLTQNEKKKKSSSFFRPMTTGFSQVNDRI